MGEGDAVEGRDAGSARQMVLPGEPRLAYQPVVDMASGRLLGFEALLRWDHPTEGLILPKLLVPWAEANGDIVALGEWVLVEGCRQATAWPSSVQVAVNCSIVQLRRKAAARAVRRALSDSGLDPDRLTVEVTEHAMADEEAVAELHAIAELGVQLSVDDVGTSWSSFDVLRRLAVNTVKIDGSFVMGLEAREGINRMVVETVVHLAHSAGMSTIAEGVESALQASIVRRFDSDAAQGYFFSPPLSEQEATALANDVDLRFPLEDAEGDDVPRGRHVAGRRAVADPADPPIPVAPARLVTPAVPGPPATPAVPSPRAPAAAGAGAPAAPAASAAWRTGVTARSESPGRPRLGLVRDSAPPPPATGAATDPPGPVGPTGRVGATGPAATPTAAEDRSEREGAAAPQENSRPAAG